MSKTNKMSLGQLTLVTAVNMIGAGIIMLPSQLAQVGAVSVFAWIISTVGATAMVPGGATAYSAARARARR